MIKLDGTVETYELAKQEFIETNNIKNGSFVRIIRGFKRNSGWNGKWRQDMNCRKGHIGTVRSLELLFVDFHDYSSRYAFPFYALEPIDISQVPDLVLIGIIANEFDIGDISVAEQPRWVQEKFWNICKSGLIHDPHTDFQFTIEMIRECGKPKEGGQYAQDI